MSDADRTPRPATTHPSTIIYNDIDPFTTTRDSIDDTHRSSPDDNSSDPSVSRSSSKASSIEVTTSTKPLKPRRPTSYTNRTSSINKRSSGALKNLNLNQSNFNINSGGNVPSPPVSARTTPKVTAFTPILERSQEHSRERETRNSRPESTEEIIVEEVEVPYFPLPPPTRSEVEVKRTPATRMYWHQPPTHGMMATAPLRRSHSVAQIGSTVYIFGGSDGKPPKATNTVYIFDTDTSFWRIPKVSGTIPPPLRAHTTTAHRQKIYLFGGGTGNDDYYNHVYTFSAQTYNWTCLIPSNRSDPNLPVPRRAHTSVLFDSGIYIFGGGSGTSGLNDLWRLELSPQAPRWTQLFPTGRKPEPRVYHTATVVRDVMIIYGGLDGKQCFSNIYLYNFHANTFTEVIIPIGPRVCRISHTTTCIGSQLFVFGGSDGTVFNNELWSFDLMSKTWSKERCSGKKPSARGYHTSVFYDARLWVFGGMDTLWEGFSDVNVLEFGGSGYLGSVYVDHIRAQ